MRTRPADLDDATAIATVHVRSWQRTYRGTFPDDFLDSLSVDARTQGWHDAVAGDVLTVHVAETEAGVVGFVATGASRDDDPDAGDSELLAIYVDPDEWGTGAGRALMSTALDTMRARGGHTATLWVLAGNVRAERFYRAAGWHHDGAAKDDTMAGTRITEHRYRRSL